MPKRIANRYRKYWQEDRIFLRTLFAICGFITAVIVNFYAGTYATERASNPVTDIILSNIPVINFDFIFIYGSLVLIIFTVIVCLLNPHRIPFVLHSLTLFILIRSVFISLTHIGPFPRAALDLGTVTDKFIFGGDLFFSGHTGIPFLLALIFWRHVVYRYLFLASSLLFGTVALLGHLHYTIDVLSAFFITYSIYELALWIFKKDRALFLTSIFTLEPKEEPLT